MRMGVVNICTEKRNDCRERRQKYICKDIVNDIWIFGKGIKKE